jgi:hypothetical protein
MARKTPTSSPPAELASLATNDQRPTTNDQRPTTNDQQSFVVRHSSFVIRRWSFVGRRHQHCTADEDQRGEEEYGDARPGGQRRAERYSQPLQPSSLGPLDVAQGGRQEHQCQGRGHNRLVVGAREEDQRRRQGQQRCGRQRARPSQPLPQKVRQPDQRRPKQERRDARRQVVGAGDQQGQQAGVEQRRRVMGWLYNQPTGEVPDGQRLLRFVGR